MTEIIETEKNSEGVYEMKQEKLTEAEIDALLAEIQEDIPEDPVVAEDEGVDEYLDKLDAERGEWARVEEDLFPEEHPSGPRPRRIHKDTDPVQRFLAKERQV